MGDGDGWVGCVLGHRHWGRHGAAGLLLSAGDDILLQHRSPLTHEGGTWALPGGARDSGEDVVQTALREAEEEAAIDPSSVRPIAVSVVNHGGWSYATVLAEVAGRIDARAANWESDDIAWWPRSQVDGLALHRGFAASWPLLREPMPGLTVVVDAANVVGARPDGWWRDRPAAADRLFEQLLGLARRGVSGTAADRLPRIVLTVEGDVARRPPRARTTQWWERAVEVRAARGSGDDAVVAEAGASAGDVVVISADRGLRARLPGHVVAHGPQWLLDRLSAA
ncbi:MAG: NUDIX domain-containing protein [bacterium]